MAEQQTNDNVDTIEDLVQHSLAQDFNKANQIFGNVMTTKLSDLMDQEKVKVAGQIYNDDPEDPVEEDDVEEEEAEEETEEETEENTEEEDVDSNEHTHEDGTTHSHEGGDEDHSHDNEEEPEVEGAAV